MDGCDRALDNVFVERFWRSVKHEDLYLKGYATGTELQQGLKGYFAFYNTERIHQALGYQTPDIVSATANGSGTRTVNIFVRLDKLHSAA